LENKSHTLAAGVFVVIMAVLLVLLATWLTRPQSLIFGFVRLDPGPGEPSFAAPGAAP